MSRTNRRILSLLLAVTILVGVLAPCALAADRPAGRDTGMVYNPRFARHVPTEDRAQLQEGTVQAPVTRADYLSQTQAADRLRQAMVNRESQIELYIYIDNFWVGDGQHDWFNDDFFPLAVSQDLAVCPYDGDYLQWSWSSYSANVLDWSGNYYHYLIDMYYYTDANEEAALDRELDRVVEELDLLSLSDKEAYDTIYSYVTDHVTYDYDGLATHDDTDLDNDDWYIYTAYAAECFGRAVCQGYASLFYALCWKAGLPVRMIASEVHSWNIVYLKDIWYCVDCTWDSGEDTWSWYLLGTKNFYGGDHSPMEEYTDSAFQARWPLSPIDYDYDLIYNDVAKTRWSYRSIRSATERGLFSGTSTYTFSPEQEITRAMLVAVLWRLAGSPRDAAPSGFSDVRKGSYYEKAVDWALAAGITSGVGADRFAPDDHATREQMAAMLMRYARYTGNDTEGRADLSGYQDVGEVSSWAMNAMSWANWSGILMGLDTVTLAPRRNTTREQMAALLIRLINYYGL